MRVAFFNSVDIGSGAEVLACKTVEGLLARGLEARLFVKRRRVNKPYVDEIPHIPLEWKAERIGRLITARNDTFFPSTRLLEHHPWIRATDVWHFHNLHGHYVSISTLALLSRRRTILLSPVDEFLSTGYCAYTRGCDRFRTGCGHCPQTNLYHGIDRDTTATLLRKKKKAFGRASFHVLVHTDYLASHYASTFVGSRGIDCLRYGVDVNRFRPLDRVDARLTVGLDTEKHFVIGLFHTAVADPRKGLLPLIEGLGLRAERASRPYALFVVGTGSQAAQAYATPHMPVYTHPLIEDEDSFAQALNVCDVMLYPTFAENLSLTCLSAMACGVPVISFDVGGQREAVRHGETGILVKAGDFDTMIDAAVALGTDPERQALLSRRARELVRREFDIDHYLDGLVDHYRRIVAKRH